MFRKGITLIVMLLFIGLSILPATGNINKLSPVLLSNNPPYVPSNPIPSGGAINISICPPNLSWTGGDPDGDNVTYDVYFGTSSPPLLVTQDLNVTWYQITFLLNFSTTYFWMVVAEDEYGLKTSGPIWSFTTEENLPPYVPRLLFPGDGETVYTVNITLCWIGGDPNPCDIVTYDVYLGPVNPPSLVSYNQTEECYDAFGLILFKKYYWMVVTRDSGGLETPSPIWSFTTGINNPPGNLSITGPTCGKVGVAYEYTFIVEDWNDDNVSFYIDWGDGNITNWTPFQPQGSPGYRENHTWSEKGTYRIKAIAKDIWGDESGWGCLEVTMPKNQQVSNMWLLRWLGRFPILQKILDVLRLNN